MAVVEVRPFQYRRFRFWSLAAKHFDEVTEVEQLLAQLASQRRGPPPDPQGRLVFATL